MFIRAFAIGALTLTAAACASGPSRDERPREGPRVLLSADTLLFASFDANADLRIDSSEIEAGIVREWTRADQNQDGALSPIEFQAWMNLALGGSNAPPYRLDFDRNVDNSITRAEFETEMRSRAADYDQNEDGVLERAEFLRDAPRPQMMMNPDGDPRMRTRPRG